jgi:hypothetical protein
MHYLAAFVLLFALYFCIKWAVAAGMEKDRLKVRNEADEKRCGRRSHKNTWTNLA